MKKFFGLLVCTFMLGMSLVAQAIVEPASTLDANILKQYSKCTKDENVVRALEMLKNTPGEFSRKAILGDNLTDKPIKIDFMNLYEINPQYANFDALGWKKSGKLYVYINKKHQDAPPAALAAVLAHEAIHQDELNSLNEETYAWTLEAAVWTHFLEDNPRLENINHPLVVRENTIHKLFVKGNYTDKYIRKSVTSNLGYQNLPERSPGFEGSL